MNETPDESRRDFRLYLAARFITLCSYQMLNVALGQYIYQLTKNPLYLGYIGLALFVPKFALIIPAGHLADRFDRRSIIFIARLSQLVIALALFFTVKGGHPALGLIYLWVFLTGAANAFDGPASQAFVPQLVPPGVLRDAITWNSTLMQLSFIVAPPAAGALYTLFGEALPVFGVLVALRGVAALLIYAVRPRPSQREEGEITWHSFFAGIRYVFQKKIILGAISLDLFAVLFGGAVALLPVYANDILHVGPTGLGFLRAAPALGAGLMAATMVRLPPFQRTGRILFSAVTIFGAFTVLFGISKNFYFSLFCLFVLGAADMISVVIRGVLVQMRTPPEMRGRVSAVNLIFIGASNELGEFESGLTARWFGTVPAVVLGGVGTLAVVGLWTWLFPELRKYKRLEET